MSSRTVLNILYASLCTVQRVEQLWHFIPSFTIVSCEDTKFHISNFCTRWNKLPSQFYFRQKFVSYHRNLIQSTEHCHVLKWFKMLTSANRLICRFQFIAKNLEFTWEYCIWQYLTISGNIWQHLTISGNTWQYISWIFI